MICKSNFNGIDREGRGERGDVCCNIKMVVVVVVVMMMMMRKKKSKLSKMRRF
jgi:hypothetical protein